MSMPRPMPPDIMFENPLGEFRPAPEVVDWLAEHILTEGAALFNEDHIHLRDASIGVLWASVANTRQGRTVLGMAESPMFRGGAWQKGRQEQQIVEWFGIIPDFLITLDAVYCAQASDVAFAALIEHELYHCAQALDEFGDPRFDKETGKPKFALRGHDVEEFIGVVRRYGITTEAMKDLVAAANSQPEVAGISISKACGTCMMKVV